MKARPILHWLTASSIAACASLIAVRAAADVPKTITHQGRLYTKADAPVSATLDVVFSVYACDAPWDLPIWSEVHSITFEDGYFSAELGAQTPLDEDIFDGTVRYIGIKVGDDPEMTPRAATRSVPYAILAN